MSRTLVHTQAKNVALRVLVEALERKIDVLRYPPPNDVAGHLEVAEANHQVNIARVILRKVEFEALKRSAGGEG